MNIFAPAKINLYLHICGKTSAGYHELDSLVAFTNFGDRINILPSNLMNFRVTGDYANQFDEKAKDISENSSNLIIRAIHAMAALTSQRLNFDITLEKNLPFSSGIGGSSSDAAAILRYICAKLDYDFTKDEFHSLLLNLGADLPVCFNAKTSIMRGIGEKLIPYDGLPQTPVLLINPNIACHTQTVFKNFNGKFRPELILPDKFNSPKALADFLREYSCNDLLPAAKIVVPEIKSILNNLSSDSNCLYAGLSGSGATCFGLYETPELARQAARHFMKLMPDYWVHHGILGHTMTEY